VVVETEERIGARVQNIPIEKIDVHKLNPRVDVGDIEALAASIGDDGLYQPILVVRDNGGWALVDGKRRLAAAKKLGLVTIPAIEREMTNSEIATAALVANLQRKDLDALEEARGYRAWLQATDGGSQADLARLIGRDHSTISNALRLLDAPKPIADALREKRITPAHARVALELKDPAAATALPLREGVTVDQLQERVTRENEKHDLTGGGAVAAAQKALADAKAKYPNATITWRAGERHDVLNLTKALGKPPQAVKSAGYVGQFATVTTEQHAKACTCSAFELDVRRNYSTGRGLVFELKRICIDAAGYKAATPKSRQPARSKAKAAKKPKGPTPEQLAKKAAAAAVSARKEAEKQVAKTLVVQRVDAAYRPIEKALGKGDLPIAAARAIVFAGAANPDINAYTGGGIYAKAGLVVAWERIAKMPAKKVSKLAQSFLANIVASEIRSIRNDSWRVEDQPVAIAVAAAFGVKLEPVKAKKARR
jgi:ParB/RepB/Spo0J family partition protein